MDQSAVNFSSRLILPLLKQYAKDLIGWLRPGKTPACIYNIIMQLVYIDLLVNKKIKSQLTTVE